MAMTMQVSGIEELSRKLETLANFFHYVGLLG